MKNVILAIGVLALSHAAANAAELKIGYINSQEIFLRYRGTEDAQRRFDQEKVKLEQELERKKQELDELRATLERQSLLMSEETKKQRAAEMEQKETEFQQYYFDYFGENGRIVKLNADLTRPIIEKMNTILNRIGEEENYTMIFDVAPGGIVFARQDMDLTDRILDELNAAVKAPAGQPTDDAGAPKDTDSEVPAAP